MSTSDLFDALTEAAGNGVSPEDLARYRRKYPENCAGCGKPLDGGPESDDELIDMVREHDRLFPGEPLSQATVVCDECFNKLVPGGQVRPDKAGLETCG